MSEISAREIVEQAAPIAQELVRLGNERTNSLLVWLLALRMAEKIEVELYVSTATAELVSEFAEDRANLEEIVARMQVERRGPADNFNLSTHIIEPGKGRPS